MATISENLQTIADSTAAIKQAIIDKGGTIEGDITTWASAISGISGGGSDEEYVFTGTLGYSESTVTVTGNLNKVPDNGNINYLLALGCQLGGLCYDSHFIGSTDSYTLTINFRDPLIGNEKPALCILNTDGSTNTVIPITFKNSSSLDTEPA